MHPKGSLDNLFRKTHVFHFQGHLPKAGLGLLLAERHLAFKFRTVCQDTMIDIPEKFSEILIQHIKCLLFPVATSRVPIQ